MLFCTANDLTQTFAYNPASQISSVARSNDAYAWTGAIAVSRGYTTNGLNQHTAAGPASFTYDARGNLTGDGTTVFAYDSENKLTAASGGASGTLAYDPMGRLYQLTASATTRFGYDGVDRIAEYDGSNVVLRRYIHGPGIDNPIAWYEGSGFASRRFLSADERGSIVSVTDSAGAVITINSYDESGIPSANNAGAFGYTGQTWLTELGLWYYKNRILSPTLGRFLQTDPIGYAGDINLYGYVRNDPVNLIDPLGLDPPNVDGGSGCDDDCVTVTANRPPPRPVVSDFGIRIVNIGPIRAPGSVGKTKVRENQCKGPPTTSGHPDDQRELMNDAKEHAEEAKWLPPQALYEKLRNGGDWDFKQFDPDLSLRLCWVRRRLSFASLTESGWVGAAKGGHFTVGLGESIGLRPLRR
jgi:RHS repeat-associated protein